MTVSTETLCFPSLYSSLERRALHFNLIDFVSKELRIRKGDRRRSTEAILCLGAIDSKLERFRYWSKSPLSPVGNLLAKKEAKVLEGFPTYSAPTGRAGTKEIFPNLDGLGSKDVDILTHKSSPTILKRKGKPIVFQDSRQETGIAHGFRTVDVFPLATASTRPNSTAGHSLSCEYSLHGSPSRRCPLISGNVVMEDNRKLHLQVPSKSLGFLHGLQTTDLCVPKRERCYVEYQFSSDEKPSRNIPSDVAECSISSQFLSRENTRGETAEAVSPELRIGLDENDNIDAAIFINHVAADTCYGEPLTVTHEDPSNETEKESCGVLPTITDGGSVAEAESNSYSSQDMSLPGKMTNAELAPGFLRDGIENGEYEGLRTKRDVNFLKEKDRNGFILLKKGYHLDDLQEVLESLNERGANIGAVDKSSVVNCPNVTHTSACFPLEPERICWQLYGSWKPLTGVDEHLCSSTMDYGQILPNICNAANTLSPKYEIHVEQQAVEDERFRKVDNCDTNDKKNKCRIKIENFSEESPSVVSIQGSSLESFSAQTGPAQCVDMAHDISHKQGTNGFSRAFLANKEAVSMVPIFKKDVETFNGISSCRSKMASTKESSFENVAVEVVDNAAEGLRPDSEEQATECSSSFEGTDNDASGCAALGLWEDSDETDSVVQDGNGTSVDGAGVVQRKKKPLTPEWKAYRRGIEWRCRWLELRIKEVQTQMAKYNGVLRHIKAKKYGMQKSLESAAARTGPFIELNQNSRVLRRKQRRRVEDADDLSSHMSKHPLFSRYEKKKRSNAEEMCTEEAIYVQHIQLTHSDCVAADLEMPEEHDFEDELERTNLISSHDSMEHLLWDIESLQMHIVKLKNHLSRGDPGCKRFLKLQLKGQAVSSPRSLSYSPALASPRNSRVLNQLQGSSAFLENRLFSSGSLSKLHSSSVLRRRNSDYDINNVVMPGNIMATYVEPARHAFIETPQWRVLDDNVLNHSNENGTSEEELDEDLYITRHAEMETKEKQQRYIPCSSKIASYGKGSLKKEVKGFGKAIGKENGSSPEEISLEDTCGPLQLNFGFVPKGKRRKRDPRCSSSVPIEEIEISLSLTTTSVHPITYEATL